jgi:hypothetical protein
MVDQRQVDFQRMMNSIGVAVREARNASQVAANLQAEHGQIAQTLNAQQKSLQELAQAVGKVQVYGGQNPDIQRIENIPGRRVPFDYLVDIPIGPNITSVQSGTITISQEGPFVAVARYATFLSQYQFEQTNTETNARTVFSGRSFGRYRPIHSAWDLNDGQIVSEVSQVVAFPGTGAPHMTSPSNASPFRSMEGDYRIKFENAGSSYPRSNIEVPSPFWTKQINSPFNLGALDFFERGEVLTFKVLPTHANNAAFGNVFGFGAANPLYPFVQSQWDGVEGIVDTEEADVEVDPIVRAPQGILTIGFHGYRIIQPPGAGFV